MLVIPDRVPLAARAAVALRAALRRGEWEGWLPGERALSERLGVSRPTLRAALAELWRQGWVDVAQGRRRRILRGGGGSVRRRVVALLAPVPLEDLPAQVIFWIDRLRERLEADGWQMETHCDRACYSGRPERALELRVISANAGVWLLLRTTGRAQQWFVRRGVPCVLSGTCHEGIDLPAVDADLRAVCRHAAGLLLGRGHRRIALLMHQGGQAGDAASEVGFMEAFGGVRHAGAEAAVVRHDGSNVGVRKCLERLLRHGDRPTALIVARSAPALLVLTHLQRLGFRVPRDVSLIARDDDHFLEDTSPEMTRYRYDPMLHARRLFRMVIESAGGAPRPRQAYGMARLIEGETLGACRT
ncbi:MAG TPA: substrate-binding domain-containing protein [Verrucomicrobiae bacterium]|nr:substrate-binding domain-containing protein [Verrucomicrobiae bacterium]